MHQIFAGRVVRVARNYDVVNSPPQFDLVQVKVRVGFRIDEEEPHSAFRYFITRRSRAPKMGSSIAVEIDGNGTATIYGETVRQLIDG